MRGLVAALIGVVLLSMAAGIGSSAAQEDIVHTVQPGETLDSIAALYGVSQAAVLSLNDLAGPDDIQPGQQLRIPQALPDGKPSSGGGNIPASALNVQTYTVQFGETLAGVAARFGVDMDALVAANGIANPNQILYGQVLVIPASAGGAAVQPLAGAAGGTGGPLAATYVVRAGETLAGIAARFGVSEAALAAANGITDPGQFAYIRVLRVPLLGSGGGPAEEPAARAAENQSFGTGGPVAAAPAPTTATVPAQSSGVGGYRALAWGGPYTYTYTHIVRTGETLSGIAAQFGISVAALAAANGIANPGYIQIGQVLYVPEATPARPVVTYTVRTGDTLNGIAARFGVSPAALAAANGITNWSYIQIAQVLIIP
ncbi:MAG: LysM peptidoglycan-binding domain-containing protein [Anaerolineae bacterium]|nr:LysM peptidoglycan-binding domain-containing protein [Anaerolineae bacterium]